MNIIKQIYSKIKCYFKKKDDAKLFNLMWQYEKGDEDAGIELDNYFKDFLNEKYYNEMTALDYALRYNYFRTVYKLLTYSNIDLSIKYNSNIRSLLGLINILCSKDMQYMQDLILNIIRENINIRNEFGETIFMRMVFCYTDRPHYDLLKIIYGLLKTDGLNINLKNNFGYTLLMHVCHAGPDFNKLALRILDVPNIDFDCHPHVLVDSCRFGSEEVALKILNYPCHNIDFNIKDEFGNTCIFYAKKYQMTKILQWIGRKSSITDTQMYLCLKPYLVHDVIIYLIDHFLY